jgi:hypothetical protein
MPTKKGSKQTIEDIEVKKDIAVAAAEQVYNYKLIGKSVGRDEDTILNWRKEDADFSDRLEQARYRFLQKNTRRAKPEFLLERLEPQIFKERKEMEIKLPEPIIALDEGDQRKVIDA